MSKDMGASGKPDRAVVNGAGQAVSALRASVPSAARGWVVVTYYRELKPWMTPYEELCRSRVYRWRWLARVMERAGSGPSNVDGRWYWTRDRIEPAQGTEAGTAETEGLGPKDDGPVRDSECAPTSSARSNQGDQ